MELFTILAAVLLSVVPPLELARGGATEGVTIALDTPHREPDIALPPVTEARRPNSPLVVIDAGHGGRDPGAISPHGGKREKNVTLALARALRDSLATSGRVRVALTRNDDSFLDLRDRYEIARRLKADLFISIHADAAPNPGASGATIYTLSEVASDREAALLAARENKLDIIGSAEGTPGADVNRILIDLAQRESMSVSADFTRALYREASPLIPFRPVYHRFASFVVLKAPDVPSILFEAGYLTHPRDVAYIHSAEGQKQISTGLRRAIEAHFARRLTGTRDPRGSTS